MLCSLRDDAGHQIYVSDVQRFVSLSKIRLWDYSARFRRAIHATRPARFDDTAQPCQSFAKISRAEAALSTIRQQARQSGIGIVVIGVF
jgi:hypothetical protein